MSIKGSGNKVKCDNCKGEFSRSLSAVKKKNFCSYVCRKAYSQVDVCCGTCGKALKINKSILRENNFCNKKCFLKFASKRMSKMNVDINHTRMIPETRRKIRYARLDSGEGKTYSKFYGVHTHRVIAERKIGRSLKPGEIVHHKDGNKRNNHPDNLEVLENQAEHARLHAAEGLFKNSKKGK